MTDDRRPRGRRLTMNGPPSRVTVLGDGAWGTALAMLFCDNGHAVTLWGAFPDYVETLIRRRENVKFLPGVRLPDALRLTPDISEAAAGADLIVMAAPTQHVRSVTRRLAPHHGRGTPLLSVAKGIENKTLLRPSQIIREILGRVHVAVLSGPSHAEEVSRRMPTSVSVASTGHALAVEVQQLLTTEYFRPYTSDDVTGVELGGALKNVIGIAAGISDGLGFGDNAKSALITRGLAEITRLGRAMGARQSTFAGLSGIGDLITTCISPHGRNHRCGAEIGGGKTLKQVLESTEQVIEGVWTCRSVHKLAASHSVEIPICEQVYRVLFRRKSPRNAVKDLMLRRPRPEED